MFGFKHTTSGVEQSPKQLDNDTGLGGHYRLTGSNLRIHAYMYNVERQQRRVMLNNYGLSHL